MDDFIAFCIENKVFFHIMRVYQLAFLEPRIEELLINSGFRVRLRNTSQYI